MVFGGAGGIKDLYIKYCFKRIYLKVRYKCPHKCPRARISGGRLFKELNWRPESRLRPGEASQPPGAFNRVGRVQHNLG